MDIAPIRRGFCMDNYDSFIMLYFLMTFDCHL